MEQQPAFRTRQLADRVLRSQKPVLMREKGHAGKRVGIGAAHRRGLCPARHSDDLLQRLIELHDVNRRRNALGRPGDPIVARRILLGIADDENGCRALLPDLENRVDAGAVRAAQIEDDHIGFAVAQ